jgi:hypothetical protein
MLLNATSAEELCLTCHGAAVTGATTDVMTGIQYALGPTGLRSGTALGALRGGGFDQARIASGSMTRVSYLRSASEASTRPKIPVGAAQNVTSAHISMTANGLTLPHVAWGNGAAGSGAGPSAEVGCGSCHNPHGNGQYRILNTTATAETGTISSTWTVNVRAAYAADVAAVTGPPAIPAFTADNIYTVTSHGLQPGDLVTIAGSSNAALNGNWYVKTVGSGAVGQESAGTNNFTVSATLGGATFDIAANGTGGTVTRLSGVPVTDGPAIPANDARNYTVMQVKSATGSSSNNGTITDYLLFAGQVVTANANNSFNGIAGNYSPTGGDYFARTVPWNPAINNSCRATVFPLDAGCATAPSAPNGKPATFSGQITAWCASCHTRYFASNNPTVTDAPNGATGASWQYPRPNDSLFNHQHRTVSGRDCLTCHVAHGSNAAMTGTFSASFPYPNSVNGSNVSGSSRLLKVDNRGTCQACHDPTGTVAAGTTLPATGANTQVP